jgi:hypothetical protein
MEINDSVDEDQAGPFVLGSDRIRSSEVDVNEKWCSSHTNAPIGTGTPSSCSISYAFCAKSRDASRP